MLLIQNLLVISCTCFRCFLKLKSDFPKIPGGTITKFDFMVNILLGEKGILLSGLLRVSTVKDLELPTASFSIIIVLTALSSKLPPCVLMTRNNTCMECFSWSFHILPIWFEAGGFLFHITQPEPLILRNYYNFP